jgi:hypothetical protein
MPSSIHILHVIPPRWALPWDCIGSHDVVDPLHIDATGAKTTEDRLALLTRLRDAFSACPSITLYTALCTSDVEAPCGCYGYSDVCDYHRHHDEAVAECWCSEMFGTVCEYHARTDTA